MGGDNLRADRSAGFSILEVLVATTAFLTVFAAVLSSQLTGAALLVDNRERAAAANAASSALVQLSGAPFEEVFVLFNELPDDDPLGPGTAPGAGFEVEGLSPLPDDDDGLVGRIEFPGDGVQLWEDQPDPGLGMPRDLDLDGAVDTANHADDYGVLPVRVIVEWRGQGGRRRMEAVTTLVEL